MKDPSKSTNELVFKTSTADVVSPDDFIVEFYSENVQNNNGEHTSIRINNLDELVDFMENSNW